jgi:hypothetical protein
MVLNGPWIVRRGHFRGVHIAFLDIFVAIFFIQNHDVRKRPDNQPLWLSAAAAALAPPCELHALFAGVVALPFLPVSAALFAETFEPPSRELYPERKAMRRGYSAHMARAPTRQPRN